MTAIHDFRDQLAYSEQASYEPFWNAVYRKAFPNMINHMMCPGDTRSQRMGIDRVLFLANGMTIAIDEKKRKEVYTDVLLEYLSVDATGAPGWINKDLAIDYLAYAFMPTKKCYLFPWQILRRSWVRYGDEWIEKGKQRKDGFKHVCAKNNGYMTHSVAVPIDVLQKTLSIAAIIDVNAELADWEYEESK